MRAPTAFFAIAAACFFCSHARAGYTHYFTWHNAPDEASLRSCIAEMRHIVEARNQLLIAPDQPGSLPGSTVVGPLSVDLNGIGDDGHEPFVFPGETGDNFCKTAGKPYDEVVTACLLIARDHFSPSLLSIESDGSWHDWAAGATLYTSVLKRPALNPMIAEPPVSDASSMASWLVLIVLLSALLFWPWLKFRKALT